MSQVVRFEKVSPEHHFYFIDFSIETIEKKEFLKINVIDKLSKDKDTFSIYKENDDGDLYSMVATLDEFEDIDSKIVVVYKNGRLKFDFRSN